MQRLQLDETALDLFARRSTRSFLTGLRFIDAATARQDGEESGFRPRQVIELCGASDTLKPQVLEHVVASFLIKSSATNETMPKERVYIFDHEGQVSAVRLGSLVAYKLATSNRENAVEEALGRVQTCCCRDSFQWLATLNHIHFQLLKASPSPLMLVINCVGSFHAIDMMTAKSVGSGLALFEQVYIFLKQFIRHHSPIVFAAKEVTKGTRSPWYHAEFLPSSWTSQVSKRIFLRILPPPNRALEKLSLNDSEEKTGSNEARPQFEAKCIVVGESRSFLCHVDQNMIISSLVGKKSYAQNQNRHDEESKIGI